MPLSQAKKLDSDASEKLKQLAAHGTCPVLIVIAFVNIYTDAELTKQEELEDAAAEAAAAAEADAQNFWPDEKVFVATSNAAHIRPVSQSSARSAAAARTALEQLQLSDAGSTRAPPSAQGHRASAGSDDDSDGDVPPPVPPSDSDWT
jgi:hypothetical protein